MAMALCPFCPSGLSWNVCSCRGAIEALRFGMIAARTRFPLHSDDGGAPAPVAKETPKVIRRPTKSEPPKDLSHPSTVPWLAPVGDCASCDRRRAALIVANKLARKRRTKPKESG